MIIFGMFYPNVPKKQFLGGR